MELPPPEPWRCQYHFKLLSPSWYSCQTTQPPHVTRVACARVHVRACLSNTCVLRWLACLTPIVRKVTLLHARMHAHTHTFLFPVRWNRVCNTLPNTLQAINYRVAKRSHYNPPSKRRLGRIPDVWAHGYKQEEMDGGNLCERCAGYREIITRCEQWIWFLGKDAEELRPPPLLPLFVHPSKRWMCWCSDHLAVKQGFMWQPLYELVAFSCGLCFVFWFGTNSVLKLRYLSTLDTKLLPL